MSRLLRKQAQQPTPHYAAAPQNSTRLSSQTGQSQPHIRGPRPVRSASASSNNRRSKQQQNEQSATAMGVATGNIGAGYGPYSVRYFFDIQIRNLSDLRPVSSATSRRKPYEFSIYTTEEIFSSRKTSNRTNDNDSSTLYVGQ